MKRSFDIRRELAARRSVKMESLLIIAWRNLAFRKLRNGLTITGVVIGIGSVVMLLSLGLGLRNLVTSQVVGSKSIKTIDVVSAKSDVLPIDQRSHDQIKSIKHVVTLARTYSSPGSVSYNDSNTGVAVFAASQSYLETSSLKINAGDKLAFNNDDDVIINTTVAKAIGLSDKDAIGKTIKITTEIKKKDNQVATLDKNFTIRSVVESGPGTELFINEKLFARQNPVSLAQLKVVVDERENVSAVREQIEGLGFSTNSPLDTLAQIDQVFRIFNLILVGFGGIGMIIAVLGMLNTLTISLLERTKEIGLLITMGARPPDINRLFMIEAVLLSLIGGVIGVFGAWLLGLIVNLYLTHMAGTRGVSLTIRFFAMPLYLVLGALIFIVLVGMAVVFYPARRASRINPVEVLRHD